MLLNLVIWIPLIGFLITLVLPKTNTGLIRVYTLIVSLITFVLSLGLIGPYWFASPRGLTFETDLPWIDTPAIHYHTGIDGVSLWLVILTTLLTPICVLISWRYIDKRIKEFHAFLLLLDPCLRHAYR